jgi:hypothetical protein
MEDDEKKKVLGQAAEMLASIMLSQIREENTKQVPIHHEGIEPQESEDGVGK